LIAHRGNVNGPDPKNENRPEYLLEALQAGYDVEVDLWWDPILKEAWTGHDEPTYAWDPFAGYSYDTRIWFHCKNRAAAELCIYQGHQCFTHDKDPYVVTSGRRRWAYEGFKFSLPVLWCYPGVEAGPHGVQVHRAGDAVQWDAYGICSDYVSDLKQELDDRNTRA